MNYKYPWTGLRHKAVCDLIRKDIPEFKSKYTTQPIDSLPCKEKLIAWINERVLRYDIHVDFSKSLTQKVTVNCANKYIIRPINLNLLLSVPYKAVYDFAIERLRWYQQFYNSKYKTPSNYRNHRVIQANEVLHAVIIKSYKKGIEYSISLKQTYGVLSWDELDALATYSRPQYLALRRAQSSNHRKYTNLIKKLTYLKYTHLVAKEQDFDYSTKLYKLYYKDKPVLIKKGALANIRADNFELTSKEDIQEAISYMNRSIISNIRYNSTDPVLYTDSTYCNMIHTATKGLFEPYNRYYPSKIHGDILKKFVCTRCGTVVILPKSTKYADLKCPICDKKNAKNYSKESIKWLTDISARFDLDIQHAENGKEYAIKLTKTTTHHVDGYCKEYNIVFEYHGSRWHGNPTVFYMDEHICPYDKSITAYQYLRKTISLENDIVKLGYNYIRIWDADFLDEKRYKQWLAINTPRINKFIKRKK